MKQIFRSFVAAFFITCIFMGAICALLVVDQATLYYTPSADQSIVYASFSQDERLELGVLGNTLTLPVEYLNEAAGFVQEYYTVLVPRPVRLALQWITVGYLGYEDWQDQKLEEEYQRNLLEDN